MFADTDDIVKKEQVNNCTVRIRCDPELSEIVESPREMEPIGTIVYGHKKYDLGEVKVSSPGEAERHLAEQVMDAVKTETDMDEEDILEEAEEEGPEVMEAINRHVYQLPVYLLDHSGLSLSTSPFGCPWDSGQLGIIYVTVSKAAAEGIKDPYEILEAEIREFNAFINGEIYEYEVIENGTGNEIDRCIGFIGDYESALEEARAEAYNKPQKELEIT